MMERILFIDRDGTLIIEPDSDKQVDHIDKFAFIPEVLRYLSKIAQELEFKLVMVTNQDGLGTDSFPSDDFWPLQNVMMRTLEGEGIHFSDVFIDPSLPIENSPNRKPGTGMLGSYLNGNYNLEQSYVIGDRESDMGLAKNLGSQAIYFHSDAHADAAFSSTSWQEIYTFLKGHDRLAEIKRVTNETEIEVNLNLDGSGVHTMETGIGFFDHMLDQLAKHSGCDMKVQVKGDLHIDEHHTVEDTALAIGEAYSKAMGSKKGMTRYAFDLPMDEAEARVSLDFSGRPWLVWNADFKREKVGELPTELFSHFFQSFAQAAGCTLHIEVTGDNEHHKIEAIFKAVGRCIRQALVRDPENTAIPSTKGSL